MYPLLLKPAVKDYIWGGTRLKTQFNIQTDLEKAAEAWVLSAHQNGPCTVVNGIHAGKTLPEVLKAWNLPLPKILVKLIDARDRLSLQVHPDDTYAGKHHQSLGKTEVWYVLDAQPGAELICGFAEHMTTEQFAAAIADNTVEQAVAHYPVKRGDVFFIPPGTVHAIGAGILLAEVQQNSDLTYRVSDWGRLGADGKPRELHVSRALDVSQTTPYTLPCGQVGAIEQIAGGTLRMLADCPYFGAQELALDGEYSLPDDVCGVLCVQGSATVCAPGCEPIELALGACVYVPAPLSATLCGNGRFVLIGDAK